MSMIKSYAAKAAGSELELYEYDAGELKPEDVEVQVDYCGICHSDLSMIDNEWGFSQYPLVAGHEVIGRVAALGSAAQDKGLKVGQRVGIGWTARSCGHSQSRRICREAAGRLAVGDPAAGKHRSGGGGSLAVRRHHGVQTAADAPYYRHQPRWGDRHRRPGAYRH